MYQDAEWTDVERTRIMELCLKPGSVI